MTPREVTRWMKDEHRAVDELVKALHDHVAVAPRSHLKGWLMQARESLTRFQDRLTQHFELEEDGGYLQAVIERQPGLGPEVERLRREHQQIGRILTSICRDLEALSDSDHLIIDHCRLRIRQMLEDIGEHEDRENLMMLSVFNSDMGTKD